MDAAWLSTVVHHLPDLPLAASELSRVLRPGAPLLIRSAFPGRHQRITLFRFFPEALGCSTLTPACLGLRRVRWRRLRLRRPRAGAPGGRRLPPGMADGLRRDAHTPLKLLTDQEYATGLARLRAAADAATGPVLDALDLLVLCKGGPAADRSGSTRR